MFPKVKAIKVGRARRFVAANGTKIVDEGVKRVPFKAGANYRNAIRFRSANVMKPLIAMKKVVKAGNEVKLTPEEAYIKCLKTGEVVNLDSDRGVYTMDMWVNVRDVGPVFSRPGR